METEESGTSFSRANPIALGTTKPASTAINEEGGLKQVPSDNPIGYSKA